MSIFISVDWLVRTLPSCIYRKTYRQKEDTTKEHHSKIRPNSRQNSLTKLTSSTRASLVKMLSKASLLLLATLTTIGFAYKTECSGSYYAVKDLSKDECREGMKIYISPKRHYSDGFNFSHGHCYMKYMADGSGQWRLDGQTIIDTIEWIFENCTNREGRPTWWGSKGTGNCEVCHVKVDFRDN